CIHRVGRACRGEGSKKGRALLFLQPHERDYIRYLEAHNVHVKELLFPKAKLINVQAQMEHVVATNFHLAKLAREAYRSYLFAYTSHSLKHVFDPALLPLSGVAKSLGLTHSPNVVVPGIAKGREEKERQLMQTKRDHIDSEVERYRAKIQGRTDAALAIVNGMIDGEAEGEAAQAEAKKAKKAKKAVKATKATKETKAKRVQGMVLGAEGEEADHEDSEAEDVEDDGDKFDEERSEGEREERRREREAAKAPKLAPVPEPKPVVEEEVAAEDAEPVEEAPKKKSKGRKRREAEKRDREECEAIVAKQMAAKAPKSKRKPRKHTQKRRSKVGRHEDYDGLE
ncbi:hypothetical protein KIPB_010800, partial [Kipferlia bialata]